MEIELLNEGESVVSEGGVIGEAISRDPPLTSADRFWTTSMIYFFLSLS